MRRRLALVIPPGDTVLQVIETERDDFGNPSKVWHDVTALPEVAAGWVLEGNTFLAPSPLSPPQLPPRLSPGELRVQLDALAARIDRMEREA